MYIHYFIHSLRQPKIFNSLIKNSDLQDIVELSKLHQDIKFMILMNCKNRILMSKALMFNNPKVVKFIVENDEFWHETTPKSYAAIISCLFICKNDKVFNFLSGLPVAKNIYEACIQIFNYIQKNHERLKTPTEFYGDDYPKLGFTVEEDTPGNDRYCRINLDLVYFTINVLIDTPELDSCINNMFKTGAVFFPDQSWWRMSANTDKLFKMMIQQMYELVNPIFNNKDKILEYSGIKFSVENVYV